jgi:hypothetical protein
MQGGELIDRNQVFHISGVILSEELSEAFLGVP